MFPQGPIQIQLSIHDFTSTFAEPSGSFKGWAEEGFTEPFWRWKRSRASLGAVGGKARVPLTLAAESLGDQKGQVVKFDVVIPQQKGKYLVRTSGERA